MIIDRIRSDELHAKNCKTIYILEAIIFKMESKMAEVRKIGSHIDFDVSNKNA